MRAYSLDLRERIVAAVATVGNYLRLRRRTDGLAPRPRPGGQPEIGPAR